MPTAKKTSPLAVAAKKSAAPRSSNAVALLTADHRDVKRLFKAYEKLVKTRADGSERQALARQICQMLTAHATIEEEIFYPAARAALPDQNLLNEAEVEHASAKDLIAQIESMGPDEALFDAKVTVLGEYIDHHVQEEEGEMFPKCRESDMNLKALGASMATRKQQLLGSEEQGSGTGLGL